MLTIDNYIPIINCLDKTSKKYGKNYCYPAQLTILKNLKKHGGIEFSIRTLNRRLRVLEDNKLIKRKRRIKRCPERGIVFKSTLYKLTKKAYNLLWLTVARLRGFAKQESGTQHKKEKLQDKKSKKTYWQKEERPMNPEDSKAELLKLRDTIKKRSEPE